MTWQSNGDQDGNDYGVFMRIFDYAGQAETGEIQVNDFTTGAQQQPSITELVDNNLS